MSDHRIRLSWRDTHLGVIPQTKKKSLVKVQEQRYLPWLMKKLYYMAVLFQMFHVGVIRIRISNVLIPVSLQVTLNDLCHGSSVKTPHMNKEQLDANNGMKQLLQLSQDQAKNKRQSLRRFGLSQTSQEGKFWQIYLESPSRCADLHRTWERPEPPWLLRWYMGFKPLMLAHNNPETKLRVKHKHHLHGFFFFFSQYSPDSFIPQRISDLLLELRCPHLDGCWGEIRLMAINSKEANSDGAFHVLR